MLVEDNLNPATGKAAHDHLEIRFANTGTADLGDIEVYYSFHDPKTGATENYYSKLPADFAVPAGGVHTAHFDDVVATDHVPVNKFSLYYTDTNLLNVTVVASAKGAAIQTKTLAKDAGGVETAD